MDSKLLEGLRSLPSTPNSGGGFYGGTYGNTGGNPFGNTGGNPFGNTGGNQYGNRNQRDGSTEETCKNECMSNPRCESTWFNSFSGTKTCHLNMERIGHLQPQRSASSGSQIASYTELACKKSMCANNQMSVALKYEKIRIRDNHIMLWQNGVKSDMQCRRICRDAIVRCPYYDYKPTKELCSLGYPNKYNEYTDLIQDDESSHYQLMCVDLQGMRSF